MLPGLREGVYQFIYKLSSFTLRIEIKKKCLNIDEQSFVEFCLCSTLSII